MTQVLIPVEMTSPRFCMAIPSAVADWLKMHTAGDWFFVETSPNQSCSGLTPAIVYFTDEDDALHFKLRWC
ncbi:MAG: hypothetical protein ACSLE1_15865 [Sphingobium sp.]